MTSIPTSLTRPRRPLQSGHPARCRQFEICRVIMASTTVERRSRFAAHRGSRQRKRDARRASGVAAAPAQQTYLKSISVQDFALVKQQRVAFGPGMNVISGQSGAGKSVLLSAFNMILGMPLAGDAANVVRSPADMAGAHFMCHMSLPQSHVSVLHNLVICNACLMNGRYRLFASLPALRCSCGGDVQAVRCCVRGGDRLAGRPGSTSRHAARRHAQSGLHTPRDPQSNTR